MPERRHVVVVGAGGAGLAAALEASRTGARVTVLEAGETVGGATARAGGVVFAADTAVQKARGIEDSVDELVNYYATISHHTLEPRLLRHSAEGTREIIGWLGKLGVTWDPARLYTAGLEFRPRGHQPSGDTRGLGPAGGAVIVAALLTALEATDVLIRTGVRVVALVEDDDRVTGVRTEAGEEVAADSVVLASGGFGAGAELLDEHWPAAVRHGDWHWYLGPDTNVGDGVRMGLAAGGELRGEGGTLLETPNFGRLNDAFTPTWLIYVNERGQRFVDETDTYCVLPHVIGRQPGGRCWALFDAAALAALAAEESDVDPYGLGVALESNWTGAMLADRIAAGQVVRAATVDELAARTGVDAAGLAVTLEQWNVDVAADHDSVYEKTARPLRPVATPPFHAVELRPAVIGITFAGLRIDQGARVLHRSGRAIPGLYGAGEVTGGLDGEVYAGGGTSIGNALVFGRTAGRAAAGSA